MARSFWKFKYFSRSIWRTIVGLKKSKLFKNRKKMYYERSSSIPACFKKMRLNVYKGTSFRRLLVNKYNVGFKLGEFAFTRKPFHFPIRKKKRSLIRR